jgi:hypothetical protein
MMLNSVVTRLKVLLYFNKVVKVCCLEYSDAPDVFSTPNRVDYRYRNVMEAIVAQRVPTMGPIVAQLCVPTIGPIVAQQCFLTMRPIVAQQCVPTIGQSVPLLMKTHSVFFSHA